MNFLEKEIRKSRRKQSMEVAMQLWERKAWLNNFFLSPNYTIRAEPQLKYPINKYLLLLCYKQQFYKHHQAGKKKLGKKNKQKVSNIL